jgi:hypothetical protein
VTGSLRDVADGKIRLTLQLVEGQDARYLWGMQEDLAKQPNPGELDDLVAATAGKFEQQLGLAELRHGPDRVDLSTDRWAKLRNASVVSRK